MLLLVVVVFCYKHMQLHRVSKEGENVFEAFLSQALRLNQSKLPHLGTKQQQQ